MTDNLPTETVSDIENNRLTVDLADAYATAGRSFPDEEEIREEDQSPEIPQGLSRELLAIMEQTLEKVDMINVREINLATLMQNPEVKGLEGDDGNKREVMELIIDCIADAVAESIWKVRYGTDVNDDMAAAQAIGEDALDALDKRWRSLYERVRHDFGL